MNLFIFHRDLRITDNLALNALCQVTKDIHFCFIFNEQQLPKQNNYFGNPSFQTMLKILEQLREKITINFFQAANEILVIREINKKYGPIKRIFWNADFTPFALKRTTELANYCKNSNIIYQVYQDLLLFPPGTILNSQNKHYRVFTPFWHQLIANQNKIFLPCKKNSFHSLTLKPTKYQVTLSKYTIKNYPIVWYQSRNTLFQKLSAITANYSIKRNSLQFETSHLSIALKFGLISIRETVYLISKQLGNFENPFNRQLAWREFYYHFAVLNNRNTKWKFGNNIQPKYDGFWNSWNTDYFEKWKTGQTGYPLIDAGINELLKTGFMHNRTRMITASFLTKNLLIDWKEGERFFAQKLLDYDPIINQASWQWVAGCGVDAQPFWRIFNPERQAKRFDSDGFYQKKWLPKNYKSQPIVDWKESVQFAKDQYSNL